MRRSAVDEQMPIMHLGKVHNRRASKFTKVVAMVFAVVFVASVATTFSAFASANLFKIQNVELGELSTSAEGVVTNFDDSSITSGVVFHEIGDSAKYIITIKNTDDNDHVIKSIIDNNENPYITYEYDSWAGETINAGDSFTFVVTARYTNGVTDANARVQVANVKFLIQFTDVEEEFLFVPNTGVNTGIGGSAYISVISLVVSVIGLTVVGIVLVKRHKRSAKIVGVVIAAIVAVSVVAGVKAANIETNTFLFDMDITIAPKTYKIAFDKNDSNATGEMTTLDATYGTPLNLTTNGFSFDHHMFVGWSTTPNGEVVYADGAEVSNLTAEDNATVTLYAQWETESLILNFDANGRSFADGTSTNTVKSTGSCGNTYTRPRQKFSHTANINDAGVRNGDYDTYLKTNEAVSFPGAARLRATITYGTEQNGDKLFVFRGVYEGQVAYNLYAGQLATYYGGANNTTTVSLDIPGDTVSFVFYSNYMNGYYGYYAVVEAYDENDNLIGSPIADCSRNVTSGEYKDLPTGNYILKGWSEEKNAEVGLYTDMSDIDAHLPGEVGENKTLYAIWEQLYDISFDGNGSTAGTMSETVHDDMGVGDQLYLDGYNFLRSGYGFAGWSTDKNAQPNGNSVIYGPNELIVIDQNISNAAVDDGKVSLYAVWVPKDTTYTLQTFNKAGFEFANPNIRVAALEDTRDGQTYAVAKLADGKWWMIENLRFDPAGKDLDDTNTNHPTAAFAATAKNRTVSTAVNCTDQASCINQYSIVAGDVDPSNSVVSPKTDGAQWYAYGIHYNWFTATAGNGTYNVTNYAEAVGDICPAGWRLPSNHAGDATASEFSALDFALGGNGALQYDSNYNEKETNFPNNFVRSGRSNGNYHTVGQRGKMGQYWGKNSYSGNEYSSYYFVGIFEQFIHHSDHGYLQKSTHLTIRCLAQ